MAAVGVGLLVDMIVGVVLVVLGLLVKVWMGVVGVGLLAKAIVVVVSALLAEELVLVVVVGCLDVDFLR